MFLPTYLPQNKNANTDKDCFFSLHNTLPFINFYYPFLNFNECLVTFII